MLSLYRQGIHRGYWLPDLTLPVLPTVRRLPIVYLATQLTQPPGEPLAEPGSTSVLYFLASSNTLSLDAVLSSTHPHVWKAIFTFNRLCPLSVSRQAASWWGGGDRHPALALLAIGIDESLDTGLFHQCLCWIWAIGYKTETLRGCDQVKTKTRPVQVTHMSIFILGGGTNHINPIKSSHTDNTTTWNQLCHLYSFSAFYNPPTFGQAWDFLGDSSSGNHNWEQNISNNFQNSSSLFFSLFSQTIH